jgi:hypothetical protein
MLAISIGLFACGSTTPGIPQSGLPDPVAVVPTGTIQQLFDGRTPARPGCRLAESHTRCTWTDPADSGRRLQVTFYVAPTRAEQALARPGAQAVEVPPADRAAVVEGSGELEVWAVAGQRGLQLSYVGGASDDAAAQRGLLLQLAGQVLAALAGGSQ